MKGSGDRYGGIVRTQKDQAENGTMGWKLLISMGTLQWESILNYMFADYPVININAMTSIFLPHDHYLNIRMKSGPCIHSPIIVYEQSLSPSMVIFLISGSSTSLSSI